VGGTSQQKPGNPQPNNSDLAQELISLDINLVAEKVLIFLPIVLWGIFLFDKSQGFAR